VERGIKIGELEQLVGSTSFASAMKQPIMLRRIDVLTLCLFAVWCLSPLGSQGLQRAYGTEPMKFSNLTTVYYINMTGANEMFDWKTPYNATTHDTKLQVAIDYFTAAFLPVPRRERILATDQDRYDNPTIPNIDLLEPQGFINDKPYFLPKKFQKWVPDIYKAFNHTSAWGIPVKLPNLLYNDTIENKINHTEAAAKETTTFDNTRFTIQTSYFNFTCGNFQDLSWETLETVFDAPNQWSMSGGSRFGLLMNDYLNDINGTLNSKYRPNYVAVASLKTYPNTTFHNSDALPDSTWKYTFVECVYDRVFISVDVFCDRGSADFNLPLCTWYRVTLDEVQSAKSSKDEPFHDNFADDWIYGTDLVRGSNVTTICMFSSFSSLIPWARFRESDNYG
jgi:hypothetical protein